MNKVRFGQKLYSIPDRCQTARALPSLLNILILKKNLRKHLPNFGLVLVLKKN